MICRYYDNTMFRFFKILFYNLFTDFFKCVTFSVMYSWLVLLIRYISCLSLLLIYNQNMRLIQFLHMWTHLHFFLLMVSILCHFLDHFTKETQMCPLKRKSDVLAVFTKFKRLVENQFWQKKMELSIRTMEASTLYFTTC